MLIANPIYDVVFKYMMEDLRVAKTFVSAIIGEKVEELDFYPQELTTKYKDNSLTELSGTIPAGFHNSPTPPGGGRAKEFRRFRNRRIGVSKNRIGTDSVRQIDVHLVCSAKSRERSTGGLHRSSDHHQGKLIDR